MRREIVLALGLTTLMMAASCAAPTVEEQNAAYIHFFGDCFSEAFGSDCDEAELFAAGLLIGSPSAPADLPPFKAPPISDSARSQ